MRFELRPTADGSFTVFDHEVGECYKSRHAARFESEHVFYRPGILENPTHERPLKILELGFGLGTNFLHLAEKNEALELTTIDRDLSGARFYQANSPDPALQILLATNYFQQNNFTATLLEAEFTQALATFAPESFGVIFFDPFSPKANPEAWTTALFQECARILRPAGRLVTYSVSRQAKDAAEAAGFEIQKHKLPPELNKRSALLAIKPGKGVN